MMLCLMTYTLQAQPITNKSGPNVTIDVNGNYKEKVDTFTGRYYIDKDGKSFPVYLSKNGKLYTITGTSAKTGKPKRKYLKV
jgi:hypothetical protein